MLAKLCADSMPLDGVPGADADAQKRVRSKVGPRADAPAHAESMGMLTREFDEVRRHCDGFLRTINTVVRGGRVIFRAAVASGRT